jgi:hypothetical protein
MITTHGQERHALVQERPRLGGDFVGNALRSPEVKAEIAVVDDG